MFWKDQLRRLWGQPAGSRITQEAPTERPQASEGERDIGFEIASPPHAEEDKIRTQFRAGEESHARKTFNLGLPGLDSAASPLLEPRFQDWHQSQFSTVMDTGPKIRIIIGLDLGTSFTKLVLGESRVRYAVPIDQDGHQNQYLIPTVLCIEHKGTCRIAGPKPHAEFVNSIKLPLLERNYTEKVQVGAVAYIALLLRHARGWLMNERASVYRDYRIEWFVNIGLPTADAFDEELQAIFREIVLAAWAASTIPGPITLERCLDILTTNSLEAIDLTSSFLHPEAVKAFPEFAAAVASYVNSSAKNEDLHVTVDVGAGTLDVTVFNVVESDGEFSYPILARHVTNLGCAYLCGHRLEEHEGGNDIGLWLQEPVPADALFAKALGVSRERLRNMDRPFRTQVQKAVGEQLLYTKRHRYVRSPKWKDGIPAFVCGGGSHCEFYNEAFNYFFSERAPIKLIRSNLPPPEDLEGPQIERYWDRLIVAYGLSRDPFEIGNLVRPENIKDDRPLEPLSEKYRERYTSKDQV